MSSQKGNVNRTRPQKHQNRFVFKNDLHDKSQKTKTINSIQVANVCERCKKIIEWKIKYKKFKPLKAPAKCTKCDQKCVKHAYHMICGPCAKKVDVCPKCGVNAALVEAQPTREEQLKLDEELQTMLKALPERKRRTFIRFMSQKGIKTELANSSGKYTKFSKNSESSDGKESEEHEKVSREDLLEKLKSLSVKKEGDESDECDFDSNDDDFDFIE